MPKNGKVQETIVIFFMPNGTSRPIYLQPGVLQKFKSYREKFGEMLGQKASMNHVALVFLNAYEQQDRLVNENINLHQTVERLERELQLSQSSPQYPQSFSPPPATSSHPQGLYVCPNTGDIKQDYVHEIKSIFSGEVRTPSEILRMTCPQHATSTVEEIPDDFEIPSINQISHAKTYATALG